MNPEDLQPGDDFEGMTVTEVKRNGALVYISTGDPEVWYRRAAVDQAVSESPASVAEEVESDDDSTPSYYVEESEEEVFDEDE